MCVVLKQVRLLVWTAEVVPVKYSSLHSSEEYHRIVFIGRDKI